MTIEGPYYRPWTTMFWYNVLQLPLSMAGLAVLLFVPSTSWRIAACTSILVAQIGLIALAYRAGCPRVSREVPLVFETTEDVVVPAGTRVTAPAMEVSKGTPIEELGWTMEQAAEYRARLSAFAPFWDDPSMDVYDEEE